MRWTNRKPKHGDKRVCWPFAWLPTRMDDDVTLVWLERYREEQVWGSGYHAWGFGDYWIPKSRKAWTYEAPSKPKEAKP